MTNRRRIANEHTSPRSLNTKSTGEILRQAREARGESLHDVSLAIQIRPSMLEAIEAGQFFGLTDPLYLKGFIRAYAQYVGLDESEVLPFFRREYDEQQTQQQKLRAPLAPIDSKRLKLTPGRLVVGVLTMAILALVGFSYNQYVSVALTPPLELNSPTDNFVSDSGFVEIKGKTEPGAKLTLNGQEVSLSPDGGFELTVALAQGANMLQLESINSLGKITKIERTVMGPSHLAHQQALEGEVPSPTVLAVTEERMEADQASDSAQLEKFTIDLDINNRPAWVEVSIDGQPDFSGMMLPGVSREFVGSREVKIKTGNGGSTRVTVNGVDQGILGENNEVVEKVYRR